MKKASRDPVGAFSSDVTLVLLTPLNDKSGLAVWLALDGLLGEDPSGSHDFLVWVSLHDVVQLLFGQELRDSELVPLLVPFASQRPHVPAAISRVRRTALPCLQLDE